MRPRSTEASRGIVFAVLGVALTVLAVGQALGDWVFLGALALVLGVLGWSGIRWGTDTRDGRDWQ